MKHTLGLLKVYGGGLISGVLIRGISISVQSCALLLLTLANCGALGLVPTSMA